METQFAEKTFQRRLFSSSQQENDEGFYRKKKATPHWRPSVWPRHQYRSTGSTSYSPFWSPTSLKRSASYKQSISKAKCATCFWQLGTLANVDKWTESPEGFYESAAAWQIYLLATTESRTGKHRLGYTARLALPVLVPYSLGLHAHAATERSLTCNSSVLWIVNHSSAFCGAFLHIISQALEQIGWCPWESENVFV